MVRLIDADALRKSHCAECYYYNTDHCMGDKCDTACVYHIDHAPTVEAVPVVRCKDCRYFGNKVRVGDTFVCNKHGIYVPKDGFCSEGKTK